MSESHAPIAYGYARVSTVGQTLDAQLDQLRAAGCSKVFREKVSGARPDRKELGHLLAVLRPGDGVVVTRIDRLARSTFDLFGIVKRIVDTGVQFRPCRADTATSTGRLMIAGLGGLADVERDLIRTRTAEGREHANRATSTWDAALPSPFNNVRKSASALPRAPPLPIWPAPSRLRP